MIPPIAASYELLLNYSTLNRHRRFRDRHQWRPDNNHLLVAPLRELSLSHEGRMPRSRIMPSDDILIDGILEGPFSSPSDHKKAIRKVRYHSISGYDIPSHFQ